MRVMLIAHTELVDFIPGYQPHQCDFQANDWGAIPSDADELAEMSGRLDYLSWDRPNPKTSKNQTYLQNIINQEHLSVLEHASATFYIDGVTRNFTHELIRHRHLSFSEVSQRYCDMEQTPFVYHPTLASMDQGIQYQVDELMEVSRGLYAGLVYYIQTRFDKPSRKVARQAARHVLPSGLETKILVTGNLRAWREVLSKRLSPSADLEFQEVAKLIRGHLVEIAPNTLQGI